MVSGLRSFRIKCSKKNVLKQLDYSIKKGHSVKVIAKQDSQFKFKSQNLEVLKVEKSVDGDNVIQIRSESSQELIWIREVKFNQYFEDFLIVCCRPSNYWTSKILESKENHKGVFSIQTTESIHGSMTLYYPLKKPSKMHLYKEVESKVLKYLGKIEGK